MHQSQVAKKVEVSERPPFEQYEQLDGVACVGSHKSCSTILPCDVVFHSIDK